MLEKYKIPKQYGKILKKLEDSNIDYCLFKQTPFSNDWIGGLDILFKNKSDYRAAISVLLEYGYKLYFTEKNEPYKTMLCKYENGFLQIMHMHRAVGWLGMVIMDSYNVVENRVKKGDFVYVPRDEDILIIHSGHILFENYEIKEYESDILNKLVYNENLDWNYINKMVKKYNWYGAFHTFISNFRSLSNSTIFKTKEVPIKLKKSFIVKSNFKKMFHKPLHTKFFLTKQFIQFFTKRISPRRKGILIVFEGVNGTGKSTLCKSVAEYYANLTEKIILKFNIYYFGWKPFLPTTKLLSKVFNQNGDGIYKKSSSDKVIKSTPKFDLKMELFFLYVFIEDYLRYLFHILPKLRRREIVICDRYFYHMYGQYPYAKNSFLIRFLVKVFPNPDVIFLLTAPLEVLIERRKDMSKANLERQNDQYSDLLKLKKQTLIIEGRDVEKCVEFVVENSWERMFDRLRY